MSKPVEQMMQEIYDLIGAAGYAPSVTLSMTEMPASLWDEYRLKVVRKFCRVYGKGAEVR